MQTVHTEKTSGNVYYNETKSILLSTTISVHKTVILPGTHNKYSTIYYSGLCQQKREVVTLIFLLETQEKTKNYMYLDTRMMVEN